MKSRIVRMVMFLLAMAFAVSLFDQFAMAEEPQGVPPLKVVYFTPKDREAPTDRHERLGRMMKNIQEFYRKGMESHGHGPLTFALEWDAPGKLKIYDVKGKDNLSGYPKGTEYKVLDEVRPVLKSQGIDIEREYVLILGAFVEWKADKTAVEHGPYAGGGNFFAGRAWACDDHLIDPDLLASKEPGAFHYMKGHCSLGMYNTLYIGGIAHELGHCFGVPHDCELDSQRTKIGHSLMGIGNHHYGEDLRGQGPGAFLSEATALRLAGCRAFKPDLLKNLKTNANFDISKLEATYRNKTLVLDGCARFDPLPLGIIVYNDNMTVESDYDAKTWVTKPDADGNFQFEISELEKVPYEMRLTFVVPGAAVETKINYSNSSGTPTLEPINTALGHVMINQLLDQQKYDKIEEILKTYAKKYRENSTWARKLKHLETIRTPHEFFEVKNVPDVQTTADLTWAKSETSKVGWYEPSRAILQECGFMEVDNTFFESGIYAHPASNYTFRLDKKWKDFEFKMGVQDGKPGSVVFVVRGDRKELYRSNVIRAAELQFKQINVSGVDKLELITEDGGDGWANDWALWLQPTLKR